MEKQKVNLNEVLPKEKTYLTPDEQKKKDEKSKKELKGK